MTKNRRSRAVTVETTQQVDKARSVPTADTNPMYGVAMLKVALELKRNPGVPVEEALTKVLSTMDLDAGDFRAYLEQNGGLLRTIRPGPKPR